VSPLSLFEDGLSVDGDFDEVPDNHPAVVQLCVPAYAEIVPVYRGRGREAGARLGALVHPALPPRRLPLAEIGNAKLRGAAYAAYGQVPFDRVVMVAKQLYFAAAEGDGGVVLDVEEIGAAQMRSEEHTSELSHVAISY